MCDTMSEARMADMKKRAAAESAGIPRKRQKRDENL